MNNFFFSYYTATCQLVRSNTPSESDSSTMFHLPLFSLNQQQPELSFCRHDSTAFAFQNLSNQTGMKGILKTTARSTSNLLSTFEGMKA